MMKAIIFDLDQTLLDRTSTFEQFVKGQHLRFKDEIDCDEASYSDAMFSFDDNGYKEKQLMFQEVCKHLDLSVEPDVLFEDFKLHYGSEPILLSGVLEMLDELHQRYRLAIITNGRVKVQATKIRISGLEKYFEVVTISEALGVKKPAPEIFLHCLSQLQLTPENCVYVGDNPKNDVEAAISVGMKGIWVENTHFDPPAKYHEVLKSYGDLRAILKAL